MDSTITYYVSYHPAMRFDIILFILFYITRCTILQVHSTAKPAAKNVRTSSGSQAELTTQYMAKLHQCQCQYWMMLFYDKHSKLRIGTPHGAAGQNWCRVSRCPNVLMGHQQSHRQRPPSHLTQFGGAGTTFWCPFDP